MDRLGDVFDALLAQVLHCEIEFVFYLIIDLGRDADTAGRRETFQARSNVDAITV